MLYNFEVEYFLRTAWNLLCSALERRAHSFSMSGSRAS